MLLLARSLQELLQNVSHKGDGNRSKRGNCTSTVGRRSIHDQKHDNLTEQQCGTPGLISLLQCSNPISMGCAVQRKELEWSASNIPQHMKLTAATNNQTTPLQQVVYVKPMGQALSVTRQGPNHLESIPFSPSSHSGVAFFNAPNVRGFSPQWKPKKVTYQVNTGIHNTDIKSTQLQQNMSKSSANEFKNSKLSAMISTINASISSAKRNLGAALNGKQADLKDASLSRERVRMGWSPLKRRLIALSLHSQLQCFLFT